MTPRGYGWVLGLCSCLAGCASGEPEGGGADADASLEFPDGTDAMCCAPEPDSSAPPARDVYFPRDSVQGKPTCSPIPLPAGVHDLRIEITEPEWDALHRDDAYEARAKLVLGGVDLGAVEIEQHGGYAKTLPKPSYRLKFLDSPGDLDLFGDGPEHHDRFVLHAQWIDPTFARNKLAHDLVRALGGLAPRVSFARVCMNGSYFGLYTLIERIDEEFLERQDLDDDAILYKASNHQANWKAKANPLDGYEIAEGEGESTARLATLLDACTFTPTTLDAFETAVEPLLHLDDFLRWQIAHTFAMDQDCYTKNYYLYDNFEAKAGTSAAKFRIVSWDADATFGLNWDGTPLDPAKATAWHGTDTFSPRLFSIPAYRTRYAQQYAAALDDGPLAAAAVQARALDIRAAIEELSREDFEQWRRDVDVDVVWQALIDTVHARHATMTAVISRLR